MKTKTTMKIERGKAFSIYKNLHGVIEHFLLLLEEIHDQAYENYKILKGFVISLMKKIIKMH